MKEEANDAAPDSLLILALGRVGAALRRRILQAARNVGSADGKEHVFRLRPGMEQDPGLRNVTLLCREAGGEAWLVVLLPPAVAAGPYRPMVDRSHVHAQLIDAWRRAEGPLPALKPGDLIQLG